MRATGIIRRFDDLGRIVIPKELRKQLFGTPEKSEGMPMEIFMDKDDIVLRKYEENTSDDVCEWKQTSTARYKTSCGYKLEEFFDTKACYCKQCGKKIKVVEQMNKRQWKKQGTKLMHNGQYASYVALFLGVEIKGKPHLDRRWLKR